MEFRHWELSEEEDAAPALLAGKAVHCAVLEPERFEEVYVGVPKFDKRTKLGKAAWAEFQEEHADQVQLTTGVYRMTQDIAKSLGERRAVKHLLTGEGRNEATFLWKREGFVCKGRADRIKVTHDGEWCIVDLKTTRSCLPHDFARSIAQYGYHRQAAWYLDGLTAASGRRVRHFFIVAYQKTPPYASAVYKLEDDAIALGRAECAGLLEILKGCRERDEYPDRGHSARPIGLPPWYSAQTYGALQ